MDPLAEKYNSITPFAYAVNNPIKFIDPNGMEVSFWVLNANGDLQQMSFNELDKKTKEWFYGWASSKDGQSFLSNFIDGKQTFSLDEDNSITIKGNGNNFDAKYQFGNEIINNDGSRTEGFTKFSIDDEKLTMRLYVNVVNQSYEDQIMTFGHETNVHAKKDVDLFNQIKTSGKKIDQVDTDKVNRGGDKDHDSYTNTNRFEYKNMRMFLYLMRGFFGGTQYTNDKKLNAAFNDEITNNKNNVNKKKK